MLGACAGAANAGCPRPVGPGPAAADGAASTLRSSRAGRAGRRRRPPSAPTCGAPPRRLCARGYNPSLVPPRRSEPAQRAVARAMACSDRALPRLRFRLGSGLRDRSSLSSVGPGRPLGPRPERRHRLARPRGLSPDLSVDSDPLQPLRPAGGSARTRPRPGPLQSSDGPSVVRLCLIRRCQRGQAVIRVDSDSDPASDGPSVFRLRWIRRCRQRGQAVTQLRSAPARPLGRFRCLCGLFCGRRGQQLCAPRYSTPFGLGPGRPRPAWLKRRRWGPQLTRGLH